jgi:hypothetical protein
MSTKRIILYRYYHKFEQNKELLQFLKYLNPQVAIYGLYGGVENDFDTAGTILKDVLTHNYYIKSTDSIWKWKNGDMTYQQWYRDHGYSVDFDVAHVIEWDLLYFESLDSYFGKFDKNSVVFTGLIPLNKWIYLKRFIPFKIFWKEWYWTGHEPIRQEWLQLLEILKTKYNYNDNPHAVLGPGTTVTKQYLEKIQSFDIPYMAVDELRFPIWAQLSGIKMEKSDIQKKWFSLNEYRYFNCDNWDIKLSVIKKELKKKNGRRVFHPFREFISFEQLVNLHNTIPNKK